MVKDPSKTEAATPKQRRKARDEGSVPRSTEMNKIVVLLVALLGLKMAVFTISQRLQDLYIRHLKAAPRAEMNPDSFVVLFLAVSRDLAVMLLPFFLFICLAAYAANVAQFGRLWTLKPLTPKFGKLFNIGAALKKLLLDTQTLVRLGRDVLSGAAVALACHLVLRGEMGRMLPLFDHGGAELAAHILDVSFRLTLYALLPMAAIAAADVFYTRWQYEENIKMSKQEVQEEHREAEGDPHIKQKQRQKMAQVMRQRMMQNVPKADVVVTNPTHYAVALKYDPSKAPAPLVVAKGVDSLALKIREVAAEHGVPVRENRPLARALYDQVEVGDVIPESLYKAVATLLARLGRFKRRNRRPAAN